MSPFLLLPTPLSPSPAPPAGPRPGRLGYYLVEGCYFRPEQAKSLGQQFGGWHDWAVVLNGDLGSVLNLARACRDGRHPVTGAGDMEGRPFAEVLLGSVAQLALAAWELNINGYSVLHPHEELSRALLAARDGSTVLGQRSAIDAAFSHAHNVVAVLGGSFGLAEGLAALRRRHAQRHVTHPWCWLRYLYPIQEAWDILHMLGDEWRRREGRPADDPERIECESRLAEAEKHWVTVQATSPGFDWWVKFTSDVDMTRLVDYLLTALERYDECLVAEQLLDEIEYMTPWLKPREKEPAKPAQAAGAPQPASPDKSAKRRRPAARDAKTEARDEWLYQQCKQGKQYKAAMLELNKIAVERGWEDLSSPQGVQQAVERYVARNNLDPLPPRKAT